MMPEPSASIEQGLGCRTLCVRPAAAIPGVMPGWKQRAARLKESSPPPAESKLATKLLGRHHWGNLSAQCVQELSEAAIADGADHPALKKLASIGQSGASKQNCYRDLRRALVPNILKLMVLGTFMLPLDINDITVQISDAKIILPHILFAALYHNYRPAFNKYILGGEGVERLMEFWTAQADNPHYLQHPVRHIPNHKSKAVPLSLHGDGVAALAVGASWQKTVETFSWSSITGIGTLTLFMNYLIICFIKSMACATGDTRKMIFRIMRWSFECLYEGKWPELDWFGQKIRKGSRWGIKAGQWLADGLIACLFYLKGDLEFFASSYGLQYWGAKNPCSLCKCNLRNIPWTDLSRKAAWLKLIWEITEWLAAHPNHCEIFDIKGVSIWSVIPDYMHCMHLGVHMYFLASVLVLLVDHILPETHEENLQYVKRRLVHHWKVSACLTTYCMIMSDAQY